MEINAIISHLEYMLAHVVGLGTYRTDVKEAITTLKIYRQRLEYEDSCGYRNELDLMKDHVKDLEDDLGEARKSLEILAGNCPYRDKFCDVTDCAGCKYAKINIIARQQEEIESLRKQSSAQHDVIHDRDEIILNLRNELKSLKIAANNPTNFCGNCKHYAQMHKDNDTYEGICVQYYIKRVDPDDASCEHFKSNQVDREKPDQPCCKACNREDCDDCTLCPF